LLLSGAAGNRINDTAGMTLNGGGFHTGGLSESLGTLTLSASSTLDFGSGASVVNFLNSSASTWGGGSTLWVTNWSGNWGVGGGTDQIIFGSDSSALTAGQVAQIQFWLPSWGAWSPATILGNGEVVPVPEPATVLGAGALAALLGWRERRRLRGLVRAVFSRS
jgi:hypothetical protein